MQHDANHGAASKKPWVNHVFWLGAVFHRWKQVAVVGTTLDGELLYHSTSNKTMEVFT